MRKLTSFTTAAAIVLTSVGFAATPAEARGRHGGYWRDRDRVDAGDIIGGIVIVGAIAALLGAASKSKDRQPPRDDRYNPPYRDNDNRDAGYYDRQNDDPGTSDYGNSGTDAESRATEACGWAAEGELGRGARVDSITDVAPNGDGWYVTGVASRSSEAARSFGCTFRGGRVVDIRFN